ncbi:MAG: beta-galactosidase [Actinomycetaceae bacterium]|nr:beta-galactosidase [Actinomycetaceae bacterium]
MPDFVAYGGDWNPDQWPEETVREDIELMQEAGVNLVSLAIFSWAKLEPSPGQYDFGWLRQIMDQCAEAGIFVDLATGTASPPVWMARQDPNSLPVNSSGVRMEFGSRQQYCPSSPTYRKHARALASALAREFQDHPALAMWHVNNEYACHTFTCHCSACTTQFQEWLRARYRDIDALNRAWNTYFWAQIYSDFSQIHTPKDAPTLRNPAQMLDYWRFSDEQLLSLYRAEADAVREYTAHLPVTTNFMGDFLPLNYREWARYVDVVSDDCYPEPSRADSAHEVAFRADLMRSFKQGQPFILMEQTTGMVQWRAQNAMKRPGQFRLWSLACVAHGADGILQFQWRQSPGGAEMFHSAMVDHSKRLSRRWPEVVQLGADLQNLREVLGSRVETEVAVVADWDSARALHLSEGPTQFPAVFDGPRQWHRTLWEANIPCDLIGVEDDLDRYRVIIVSQMVIDYPDFASRLTAAVKAGAQVVVTAPTAVMDPTMRAVLDGYLGSLSPLLGVRVTDLNLLAPQEAESGVEGRGRPHPVTDRISSAVGVPGASDTRAVEVENLALRRALEGLCDPTPAIHTGLWGELLKIDSDEVEVAATFADGDLAGEPAITRHQVGQGQAWYVATDLDSVGRAALLRVLAASGRVSMRANDLPAGVEYVRRGELDFYLNHGDKAVELAGITGVDRLTGQALTGHVVLGPRSAVVVADK